MNLAYLLTGGNLGNREELLSKAAHLIQQKCGNILRKSSIYETSPWGLTNQPGFLNQVLEVETSFGAEHLMEKLLLIEEDMGRKRAEKYGPRTIDIDILLFNQDQIHTESVTIPHPRIHERRFVLVPLCELDSSLMHPVFNQTMSNLLENCSDIGIVKKFSSNN